MESFVDFCKNYILDTIDGFENSSTYGSEIAYLLTNEPNVSGTLTFDSNAAKEYIKTWWDDCADYWEYEEMNFSEHNHNPFDNPDGFMVCMVIEGCASMLSRCPVIESHWNNKLELSDDVIAEIKEYVENFDNDKLF